MVAVLYKSGEVPKVLGNEEFTLPNQETGFAKVSEPVALALGCTISAVDILDCGPDFVAYSIFDYEGDPSENGMSEEGLKALMKWTKHPEAYAKGNAEDLGGPLLLVTRS